MPGLFAERLGEEVSHPFGVGEVQRAFHAHREQHGAVPGQESRVPAAKTSSRESRVLVRPCS